LIYIYIDLFVIQQTPVNIESVAPINRCLSNGPPLPLKKKIVIIFEKGSKDID
jgi:hypothetical protein